MRTRSIRHLTSIVALALSFVAVAAAGGSAVASPATGETPGTGEPGTAVPSIAVPSVAVPSIAVPGVVAPGVVAPSPVHPIGRHSATGPPDCMGAVIYTINASDAGSLKRSVCIAVGGVVRVENLGPGNLSASPSGRVSCWYEAAVYECRLIRTGTVAFKIHRVPKAGSLTVKVAEASSPPKPSPACLSGTTHVVDASVGGPPWAALCVKLDVVLRVENLGPDGLSADPADTVSCRYEADVWECRFVKAGTMTITTAHPMETRSLTLVVVK